MKKLLVLSLSLAAFIQPLLAEDVLSGDILYNITQFWGQPTREAVVIGFREGYEPVGKLTIPSAINFEDNEIPVVGLGYSSFSGHAMDKPVVGDFAHLTSVRIPSTMRFIGQYEFMGCPNISEYEVEDGCDDFMAQNGSLCQKVAASEDRWELFRYPSAATNPTYALPSNLEYICVGAFAANTHLRKIYLSGKQTFLSCWQLGNKSIEEVDCSNSDYYSNSDDGAVYWGSSLAALCPGRSYDVFTVHEGSKYLTNAPFCNASVRKVVIPSGITNFTGSNTFMNCEVEEIEYLGDAPSGVWPCCFAGCRNLTKFTLGTNSSGNTSIDYCAFYGCESLESITFAEGTKSIEIGYSAFEGCASLKEFPLTKNIKVPNLPYRSFAGCTSLTSFLFGNIEEFDDKGYQFAGSGLVQAHWPSAFPKVPQGIFSDCLDLAKVYLKTTTTDLMYYTFSGSGITAVNMAGVEWYYPTTFEGCKNLIRLYFPSDGGNYAAYRPVAFSQENSQVVVDNPNLRYLNEQTAEYSDKVSLYVSMVNGGVSIGDGWKKVYVPGRAYDLYSALTKSDVVEMFSYDTYPELGAVAVKSLVPEVKIKSVTIEGKDAEYVNGLFKVEDYNNNGSKMDVSVKYTVSNCPMTSTYEYVYTSTGVDAIPADNVNPDNAIYTLQGIRMPDGEIPPGIYIRNDRKIIVK